jgi:hypothetical protein
MHGLKLAEIANWSGCNIRKRSPPQMISSAVIRKDRELQQVQYADVGSEDATASSCRDANANLASA